MKSDTPAGPDWRAIADELAAGLRTALVRNPNLSAAGWDLAQAALVRYDDAGSVVVVNP